MGDQLFTLKQSSLEDVLEFAALERMLGLGSDLKPEDLRQLVYQLDMYEKYPNYRPPLHGPIEYSDRPGGPARSGDETV